MSNKTHTIRMTAQEYRDARELVERGRSDIDHYLDDGNVEVDGYTCEELEEMRRLSESGGHAVQQAFTDAQETRYETD